MPFDSHDDPFKIRVPSALRDLFRRGIGARRARPAAAPAAGSGPASEPEFGPEPIREPGSDKKPAAKVVLRNPTWDVADVGFNEEASISIEADLPAEHAHKTRVAFELFAVTPDGPESISKADGQIKDGKATAKIPVYIPEYKDEDFRLLKKVDYYFTAKHSESDLFKDEKAVKTVERLAGKLLEVHVLDAVTFATDKSFLRASQSAGLKALGQAVAGWRGKHPDGKLAVFGHADAVGQEEHNKKLSERRARAVHAYLAKDPKPWAALHDEEKWGLATTQELLKHLGHDPGAIDGVDGPKTQAAVKDFQGKKGLGATGAADAATREALYLAFMEGCGSPGSKAKDFDAVDGLPYGGCSEFNLVENTPGASEANRRVAVLLLKSNKNFPVDYPCRHGDVGPCRKQAARAGERKTAGFKCLFYDQLVVEKKGGGVQPAPAKLKLAGVKAGEEAKQYVNLSAPGPGNGKERMIEAEVEGAADGTKIFWKVTADPGNSKRNDPKPGLKPDSKGKLTELKSGAAEIETEVKGGKAACVLACGLAGGDKFTVEAGLAKGKADASFTVINWRKLYYQLTVPKGMVPSIEKLKDAMTAIHVDCEKFEEVEIPLEDGPIGSWINGEDVGRGTGRKLAVGSHNREYFHKKFKASKVPLEAHYMFCHFQLDGAASPEDLELVGKKNSKVIFPGEKSEVHGISFKAASEFPGYKIFPVALQNGKPAVNASWSSKAASGPHKGKAGTIPADHIAINYKDFQAEGGRVYAKFPAAAKAVVEAGEDISLSFSVEVAKGWYNGESDGHLLLIAGERTKSDGKTIDWDGINGTMGHELGHAMKMTAMSTLKIPGIPDVRKAHTRWYNTSRGHQGDHCAKGVPQDKYDDPKEKMSDYAGTCVMFGAGVAGRSHKFCELCAPLLQSADLSSITK